MGGRYAVVKSSYLSNSERVEGSQGDIVFQWAPPILLKVENEHYWKRLQKKSKNKKLQEDFLSGGRRKIFA